MPIDSNFNKINTSSIYDDGGGCFPEELPPDEAPKPDEGSPLDNPNLRSYWWERFTDITNPDPLGPIGRPPTDDEIAAEFEFYHPGRALDLPLQNLSADMRSELEFRRIQMQFAQDAARAQASYDAQRASIYEADAARANIQDSQLQAEFDALMQKYFDSGGTDTAALQAAQAIYNQATANGTQLTGQPADWAVIMGGTTVVGQVNITDSPSIIQTNSYWQTRLASWGMDVSQISDSIVSIGSSGVGESNVVGRPLNDAELQAIAKLDELINQADGIFWDSDTLEGLKQLKDWIISQVNSLPPGKTTVRTAAVVAAINAVGSQNFSDQATTIVRDLFGKSVSVGPDSKCNIFVANALVSGSDGVRFVANTAAGRGFPLIDGKIPVANWLGDSRDTQNLGRHLPILTTARDQNWQSYLAPGDILAWRSLSANHGAAGHSAIYLGFGLVAYAGASDTGGVAKITTLNSLNSAMTGSHEPAVVRRVR